MQEIIELQAEQWDQAATVLAGEISPVDPSMLKKHAPAVHFLLLNDGKLAARCSIWHEAGPMFQERPVGVLGHYAAKDRPAGVKVLDHAADRLRKMGLSHVVGPMDGNTWRRYRLITVRGSEPVFFMEPDNPVDWPGHFTGAGFVPLAEYFSALNSDLSVTDPRAGRTMDRLAAQGVSIRSIEMTRFEQELEQVYRLSMASFSQNYLFTPIQCQEFVSMYLPVRQHVRPELVLMAEREGELVGFMFGVGDLNQAKRGEPVTTAIAKTLAILPGRSVAGLGSVLVDRFQQEARGLGFDRVIHALMHQSNCSMNIAGRFGKQIRQYTLFVRELH